MRKDVENLELVTLQLLEKRRQQKVSATDPEAAIIMSPVLVHDRETSKSEPTMNVSQVLPEETGSTSSSSDDDEIDDENAEKSNTPSKVEESFRPNPTADFDGRDKGIMNPMFQ